MDGSRVAADMEARLPTGVPAFQIITENEYRIYSPLGLATRSPFLEEVFPCECRYREGAGDSEAQACGERSNCINRTLSIECNRDDCPCRDNCQNQRFQTYRYADVEVIEAAGKGFGLRTLRDLDAGHFIMEYVGEVLNQSQFEERARKYTERGQRHHYFMTLQNDQVIDATQRGNLSRFMNHSCNPNCATQKWIVNGRLRIGLFALRKIRAGTELTFDYKFIRFGADAQKCLCGEPTCKGVIGEEQREAAPRSAQRATAQEEHDAQLALEKFTGETGVEDEEDMALLARTVLRTEDIELVRPLLRTLELTTEAPLLRRFVSLHGLQIINVLLGLHWRDIGLIRAAVAILDKLPVTHRNVVEDSHIGEKVARLIHRDDLDRATIESCRRLMDAWDALEMVYRIPKASAPESTLLQETLIHSPAESSRSETKPVIAGYSLASEATDKYKKTKWAAPSSSSISSGATAVSSSRQSSSAGNGAPRESDRGAPPFGGAALPSGWDTASAPDGRIYYYHKVTRETRWDPPTQPDRHERRDEEDYERRSRHNRYEGRDDQRDQRRSRSRERDRLGAERRDAERRDAERRDAERRDMERRDAAVPSARTTPSAQADDERRLKEIIERAKRAAMVRAEEKGVTPTTTTAAASVVSLTAAGPRDQRKRRPEGAGRPGSSRPDSEDRWQRYEAQLRELVSQVVVKYLSRWCRSQLPSPEAFKDLARKLTHGIVEKEIRQASRENAAPPKVAELPSTKRGKIKTYLVQYLRDHGYRVEGEGEGEGEVEGEGDDKATGQDNRNAS